MVGIREFGAIASSICLVFSNVLSASTVLTGVVNIAQGAHVGTAPLSVGSTVFAGDSLGTEEFGALQVRVGAARFALPASSRVLFGDAQGIPSITLLNGTAIFSTSNSKALVLKALNAEFRPQADGPTVGEVRIANGKELIVLARRGALTITVDGESEVIPESKAYRVLLDPAAIAKAESEMAQGARGAGAGEERQPPRRSGRTRFMLIIFFGAATAATIGTFKALESPDRP